MSKMNKVSAIAAAVAAASCVGVCCVPVLAAGCFFRIRPCVFTPFARLRQFDAFVERFFESVVFHSFFLHFPARPSWLRWEKRLESVHVVSSVGARACCV